MSMLDYQRWNLAEKKRRWDELRKVLAVPWNGDRGWEGRTIGLHLPNELRNHAVRIQERLQLKSMKEVLFKALTIGLNALDDLPPVAGYQPALRVVRAPAPVVPIHSDVDLLEEHDAETSIEDFDGEEEASEPSSAC